MTLDLSLPRPGNPRRGIGLVGCGWVATMQAESYARHGYRVVAVTDHTPAKAEDLARQHAPGAIVHDDVAALLTDPQVEVVDIAVHTADRPAVVEQALRSGRPVLSQKPFVDDLATGERLCDLADELGVVLAVNQNGRWAPHFAALLAAVRSGALGAVTSADFAVYWNHVLVVADKPAFAGMRDLILYDFGIHWFDVVATLVPDDAVSVYAQAGSRTGQPIAAPAQAQVLIQYPHGQVSVLFRGGEPLAEVGRYRVNGTRGTIVHEGGALGGETVTVHTADGATSTPISPDWFDDGFAGAMGELLAALDEGRPPSNGARSALPGLALAFAAVESAERGVPVRPGAVRRRPVLATAAS